MGAEVKNGRNRPATPKQLDFIRYLLRKVDKDRAREIGEEMFGFNILAEGKPSQFSQRQPRYTFTLNAQNASDYIEALKALEGGE